MTRALAMAIIWAFVVAGALVGVDGPGMMITFTGGMMARP